ncbi:MAG: 5-bromo-4-chloroindolyl phosphate hydrolysis family protein [Spirochaetes bacterium]|nr:5-bromo-4-chloroindolyl phosphate hydrolysis family protein [Spirochaetota bacterium]
MKKAFLIFLLGTAVFAALFRFTPLGFLLSSIAGIAAVMVSSLLLRGAGKIWDSGKRSTANPARENAQQTAAAGIEKIRAISNSARMIRSNAVALQVRGICKTGLEIFEYLMKNPQDLGKARQFINYYVDATKKIVEQYIELSGRKEMTSEISAALARVEGMLASVKETYDRQLAHLYEHDLLDLNAEITLLKKTMELEK